MIDWQAVESELSKLKSILIIEENSVIINDDSETSGMGLIDFGGGNSLVELLGDQCEIISAGDEIVGLDIARKHCPDLILLAWKSIPLLNRDLFKPNKPKVDAYGLLQAIQREQSLKGTPIIIMAMRKEEVTARIPEPFVGFELIEISSSDPYILPKKIREVLHLTPQDDSMP